MDIVSRMAHPKQGWMRCLGGLKSGEGDMNWPMCVQLAAILEAALGLAVFIRNLIKDLRVDAYRDRWPVH